MKLILAWHFSQAPTCKYGPSSSRTHSDSLVGWFFTHDQAVELLQRLLLALAFEALGSQLTQGLVELLEGDHAGRLGPVKDHRRQDGQQHRAGHLLQTL